MHQDTLHGASHNVDIDVPHGAVLVYGDLAVVEDAVVVNHEALYILVADLLGPVLVAWSC